MRLILILAFFLGLISIVVPLKFLGITTRRRGVIVMILSFGILVLYSAAFMPNMVTPVSVSNPNSLLLATKPNLDISHSRFDPHCSAVVELAVQRAGRQDAKSEHPVSHRWTAITS